MPVSPENMSSGSAEGTPAATDGSGAVGDTAAAGLAAEVKGI
jgi:hypothetical protein